MLPPSTKSSNIPMWSIVATPRFTSFLVCLSLFLLTTFNVVGQVSHGQMQNNVVCGETSNWEVIVSLEGTLQIETLPPGFFFDSYVGSTCDATFDPSNLSFEVTDVPCTITYSIYAECDAFRARDEEQGGDPDFVFKVGYLHNGNSVELDVTSVTAVPVLQLEEVSNGTPTDPSSTFSRTIRLCQDGLNSYIDDPVTVCFTNQAGITTNSVTLQDGGAGIALTVTNDCFTIDPADFTAAIDRNGMTTGLLPNRLEGSLSTVPGSTAECLFIDVVNTLDCFGPYAQTFESNWGCNGEDCALPETEQISSSLLPDVPKISVAGDIDWYPDGCFADHTILQELTFTNTGTGTATNIEFQMGPYTIPGYVSVNQNESYVMSSFTVDYGDGAGPQAVDTSYISEIGNPSTVWLQSACQDQLADFGIATSDLAYVVNIDLDAFDLPPGESMVIAFERFYCCRDICNNDPFYPGWHLGTFDNSCETASFTLTPKANSGGSITAEFKGTPEAPSDINDEDFFEMDFFSTNYYFARPDNIPVKFVHQLQLDCGLVYAGGASYSSANGEVAFPTNENFDAATGILDITYDLGFLADGKYRGGTLNIPLQGLCEPCGGGAKNITHKTYSVYGAGCDDECWRSIDCDDTVINLRSYFFGIKRRR